MMINALMALLHDDFLRSAILVADDGGLPASGFVEAHALQIVVASCLVDTAPTTRINLFLECRSLSKQRRFYICRHFRA